MPASKQADVCVFAPSPILTITIERGPEDVPEVHLHPGGQGFWVARMAAQLGANVRFCGPFGGESGLILKCLIAAEDISVVAVESSEPNGSYIHDRRDGDRAVVVETAGAKLGRHETDDFYNLAVTEAIAAGTAVITGTMQPGVLADHAFTRLAKDLGENGVAVIADLSGEQLRGISGLHTLKVSHEELARDGFVRGTSVRTLASFATRCQREGIAKNVIISRAEESALGFIGSEMFEIVPPKFDPVDHRGAGDSMTAAVTVGISRGLTMKKCLALGAAAGALNVTRHGLGTGRRESVEQLASEVEIRPVKPSQRTSGQGPRSASKPTRKR